MTDSDLLADLETLKAARRSGAKQITMRDRTVIYRDDRRDRGGHRRDAGRDRCAGNSPATQRGPAILAASWMVSTEKPTGVPICISAGNWTPMPADDRRDQRYWVTRSIAILIWANVLMMFFSE